VNGSMNYLSSIQGVYKGNGLNNFSNLVFLTSNADRMVIDENGKLGINEPTPQNRLDVGGNMVIGEGYSGTNAAPTNGLLVQGNVGFNNTDGGSQKGSPIYQLSVNRNHSDGGSNSPIGIFAYNNGSSPSTAGAGTIHFQTALGTYASPLAVTTNTLLGVIGFGGYDGSAFSVPNFATMQANAAQNWTTSAKGSYLSFYTTPNGSTSNAERLRIDQNGNVGIGCLSPQYKLHVVGDIAAQGGTLRASSATVSTTITACSDFRFKQNITPLSNALENVMKLKGVTYDWRNNEFPDRYFNDRKQIGIIAQELETVYPELVNTDEKGYKSVDYSKMTPILVEAIKTQQGIIDAQKNEIDNLKKQSNSAQLEMEGLKKQSNSAQLEMEGLKKQMAQFSAQLEALAKKQN
jgi:hypothetical protein